VWICGGAGWGFFLPFHIREEEAEAKGKLRAWSCREHSLLRRPVVAFPPLIRLSQSSIDARHTPATKYILPLTRYCRN
jgi:hypothetical protein